MKNAKKNRMSLLPVYGLIPLIATACATALTYYGTKLLSPFLSYHDLSLGIDHMLPFVPAFVVFYVLAFAQWVTGLAAFAWEGRDFCYSLISGEIIAKLICMALFLIIPTAIERPEVTSGDIFSTFTRFIYSVDAPNNLFPSIHCLESWACLRGALKMKKAGAWYKGFSLVLTLLVFASTVLIKQHFVIDIFAGVLVFELGLFISAKTGASGLFYKLEERFTRN